MIKGIQVAARRYAGVFFEDVKARPAVAADWERIRLQCADPVFLYALKSPGLRPELKVEAILKAFGSLDARTAVHLRFLVFKGRLALIAEVATEIAHLVHKAKNVLEAELETAVPLDAALLGGLQAALEHRTGRAVDLEETVRPDLLGGFRITWEDRQLDFSIKGKLERIRDAFHRVV